MASEQAKPIKGILKNSTSFEKADSSDRKGRDMKWDEMNILATYHPEGKEYGHMKIDEPPTPYAEMEEEEDEHEGDEHKNEVDPDALAKKLQSTSKPKAKPVSEDDSSEEDEPPLTGEEKEKRRQFELKRKLHYNEFMAVKLGRQLIDEDEDDDDDDGEKKEEAGEKEGKKQTTLQAEAVDSNMSVQSEDTTS